MFTKAAGYIAAVEQAGCDTPVTDFYQSIRARIASEFPQSYQDGVNKTAQVAPEDAWKAPAATGVGLALGGTAGAKLSPFLVGKGGRARALVALLAALGGGAVGNAVATPSKATSELRVRAAAPKLQQAILQQRDLQTAVGAPLKGLPSARAATPSASFANGNPLLQLSRI